MDREMRKIRRVMLAEFRKSHPSLPARKLFVVKGSDGEYTGYLDLGIYRGEPDPNDRWLEPRVAKTRGVSR